jgi:hypothetical protein
MPQKILSQCCVRTYLQINDDLLNQGSGVIVTHDSKYYVLTAEHCISGENGEYTGLSPSNILIEYQDDYTSPFKKIEVITITELNKAYDWALIEIT